MAHDISFGTDGWRAVIADGFTFDNVRRVTSAVAVAARSLQPPPGVDRNALVVGYDRRFLSREFAEVVADTLRAAGYRVVLSKSPTPSQTISFTAHHRKVLGGVERRRLLADDVFAGDQRGGRHLHVLRGRRDDADDVDVF